MSLARTIRPVYSAFWPGLGVEGGHATPASGCSTVSRVARDPSQPNLRQVHLIQDELNEQLRTTGFDLAPGQLGENITTEGLDLLELPTGTRLRLGAEALLEITGLRNPCIQLDAFQPGLMAAVLSRDAEGRLVRKAGVMGVVITGGLVKVGDEINVELPPAPHHPLEPV